MSIFKTSKHLVVYSHFLSHNCLPIQQRIFTKAVSPWCVYFAFLSEEENSLHLNSLICLTSEVAAPHLICMCVVSTFFFKWAKNSVLGLLVSRLLGVLVSFVAYLRAGILSFKENNKLNESMPENPKPASYKPSFHACGQISSIKLDPLVSSESQTLVFFSLKMKMKVNCRGCEQLRSFSIGSQLHQLKHRMVPIQDDQADTCQIGLS